MTRRLRLALLLVGGVVVVNTALLVGGPAALKGPLQRAVVDQANAALDADLTVGDATVDLWTNFPAVSLALTDVRLSGHEPFAGVDLFTADELVVGVNLRSLRSGPLEVQALTGRGLQLNVKTNEAGASNADIVVSSTDTEPAATPELWLRHVALEGVGVTYEDEGSDTTAAVSGLAVSGSGDLDASTVTLQLQATAQDIDAHAGVDLLRDAELDLAGRFVVTPATSRVEAAKTTVRLNTLAVGVDGVVEPRAEGTAIQARFAAEETGLKALLSLIPGACTEDFADVDTDGQITLTGEVDGVLSSDGTSLPKATVQAAIREGRFRYPSLPVGVDGIVLEGTLTHPGGPLDAAVLDVPSWSLAVDGSPLRGSVRLAHLVTDPDVSVTAKGKLDVGRLLQAFPEHQVDLTGTLQVDMAAKGRQSAFESANVSAVTARGTMALTDSVYEDPAYPLPFQIKRADVSLDPRRLDLADLEVTFGESDVEATGSVENVLSWMLSGEPLKGRFAVSSSRIDARPFEGDPDAPPTPGQSSVVPVPKGFDVLLDLDLDQVKTHDYDLRAVRGQVGVKDTTVRLRSVKARTWGGEVSLAGTYTAPSDRWADIDLEIGARGLSVGETLAANVTAARMVPIAKGAPGRVDTDFSLQARLEEDLFPSPQSLVAAGLLTARKVTLQGDWLGPLGAFTGNPALQRLELDRRFDFDVQDGFLKLPKVPVSAGPGTGVLSGRAGVTDGSLDLKVALSVPSRAITGGKALGEITDVVKRLDLDVLIDGTWDKPKVRVKVGKKTVEQALELVDDEFNKAVDVAREEADRILAAAEAQAAALRARADEEFKKAVKLGKKECEKRLGKGNLLSEGCIAGVKTGARKAKQVLDKKADKILADARKKADELVDKAEDKARR